MAAGARYTVVVSSLTIYTNADDAKAYRNPQSTITNTSSSIEGAGTMYINNFAGWQNYAPAVPIWFIPSWGGAGWELGWVNDNKNKIYTVTFKNWDGTTLKTQQVEINKNASAPSSPSRTGYVFTGWSGTYTNVTSNRTITATFSINQYTVTFKNYNGTTLKTQIVNHGSSASPPSVPARTGYTFSSWSGTYTNVTSNRTITATFSINQYTVTFKNWNGTTLKTQTVNYGSNASAPTAPSRTGYTFSSWSGTYTNVTSNRTITAVFTINSYTVRFENWNGTLLKSQTVNYGSNASPPASPTRTGYTFSGWSGTYTSITSSRTITATFTINSYSVVFKDWDGTTLKNQTVNYGSNASPPTNPTRVGYNFIGWSGTYTNITSTRTITATYERAVPNFVMKVNGSNRNAAQMWVKVNGQLRIAEQAKVLVSGNLRDI